MGIELLVIMADHGVTHLFIIWLFLVIGVVLLGELVNPITLKVEHVLMGLLYLNVIRVIHIQQFSLVLIRSLVRGPAEPGEPVSLIIHRLGLALLLLQVVQEPILMLLANHVLIEGLP
jgi:hypothetical protein